MNTDNSMESDRDRTRVGNKVDPELLPGKNNNNKDTNDPVEAVYSASTSSDVLSRSSLFKKDKQKRLHSDQNTNKKLTINRRKYPFYEDYMSKTVESFLPKMANKRIKRQIMEALTRQDQYYSLLTDSDSKQIIVESSQKQHRMQNQFLNDIARNTFPVALYNALTESDRSYAAELSMFSQSDQQHPAFQERPLLHWPQQERSILGFDGRGFNINKDINSANYNLSNITDQKMYQQTQQTQTQAQAQAQAQTQTHAQAQAQAQAQSSKETSDKAPNQSNVVLHVHDMIQWLPHGRAFVVLNRKAFVDCILPKYFPHQTEFASFLRQLNKYGFLRLTMNQPTHHTVYYRDMFLRGRKDLCCIIPRSNTSPSLHRQGYDPETEPCFDDYPPILPTLTFTQVDYYHTSPPPPSASEFVTCQHLQHQRMTVPSDCRVVACALPIVTISTQARIQQHQQKPNLPLSPNELEKTIGDDNYSYVHDDHINHDDDESYDSNNNDNSVLNDDDSDMSSLHFSTQFEQQRRQVNRLVQNTMDIQPLASASVADNLGHLHQQPIITCNADHDHQQHQQHILQLSSWPSDTASNASIQEFNNRISSNDYNRSLFVGPHSNPTGIPQLLAQQQHVKKQMLTWSQKNYLDTNNYFDIARRDQLVFEPLHCLAMARQQANDPYAIVGDDISNIIQDRLGIYSQQTTCNTTFMTSVPLSMGLKGCDDDGATGTTSNTGNFSPMFTQETSRADNCEYY